MRHILIAAGLLCVGEAGAQLSQPNTARVAMGHLHYFVDDVARERDFWVMLGGQAQPFAAGQIVTMPGVAVLISEGGDRELDSLIDHVAFRVRSLDALSASGFELELLEAFPGIASVYTPSGIRIELFEEGTATNVGFDALDGTGSASSGRHNRALVGALDSHHLHFYLPEDQVEVARDWYVDHFGAVPGVRWRYEAADLPGMNLNFSATDAARAPTSGRILDHIGFEVDDLAAFCESLEASGIQFDQAFTRVSDTFAMAVFTDPWGTTIELTEGLRSF